MNVNNGTFVKTDLYGNTQTYTSSRSTHPNSSQPVYTLQTTEESPLNIKLEKQPELPDIPQENSQWRLAGEKEAFNNDELERLFGTPTQTDNTSPYKIVDPQSTKAPSIKVSGGSVTDVCDNDYLFGTGVSVPITDCATLKVSQRADNSTTVDINTSTNISGVQLNARGRFYTAPKKESYAELRTGVSVPITAKTYAFSQIKARDYEQRENTYSTLSGFGTNISGVNTQFGVLLQDDKKPHYGIMFDIPL